ncbi:MAG: DUF3168 domain-containing protein [Brevundimonas sp.]|uniref:DUF3168 domain-containing protein n=1 Tax=Brevundimonas sp. TaxID=1871086 RepID=UPI003001EE22
MTHELALQKGILARLKAEATLDALIGGRIWDAPPPEPTYPHVKLGRSQSRPVAGGDGAMQHQLTLIVASRFCGTEEARAVAAAVRVCLGEAVIEADGVRSLKLDVPLSDVFAADDRLTTWAVIRVRAVTQDI